MGLGIDEAATRQSDQLHADIETETYGIRPGRRVHWSTALLTWNCPSTSKSMVGRFILCCTSSLAGEEETIFTTTSWQWPTRRPSISESSRWILQWIRRLGTFKVVERLGQKLTVFFEEVMSLLEWQGRPAKHFLQQGTTHHQKNCRKSRGEDGLDLRGAQRNHGGWKPCLLVRQGS